MIEYPKDQIISMTELQKLSFKKLRKKRLPLFVIDQKSKRRVFVIADAESYQGKIPAEMTSRRPILPSKRVTKIQGVPDYRNMGLLWDRRDLTNEEFHRRLKNGDHPENPWAVGRLLERARSERVREILSLEELKRFFPRVRLRPPFQEAWSRALHYWTETS